MDFKGLLVQKKSSLLKRWTNLVLESYPPDARTFLKKQKNAFANPVGRDIRQGLEDLLNQIVAGGGRKELAPCLDRIVRIRAVQGFTPSQALAFVPQLKGIVRQVLGEAPENEPFSEEWSDFEARVDDLTLQAFDLYAACRQRLADIRLKDEQRRVFMLLKRANIICEQEEKIDLPDLRESGLENNNEAR